MNLLQVNLTKVFAIRRVSNLLSLGAAELIQTGKAHFPLPLFGLELSTRSSPEPTRCKESLLGWECSWKGFALWLKEKEQGILLFMPTLHWDVMSGAMAATLDHGRSKTGRSWVLRDIIVLTNWPLDSPASDSCCLRTKRLYCVSCSQPRILLLTATTS